MITQSIPMEQIYHDVDFNCRGHISPLDVKGLADDIRIHGLLQPIVVQPMPETHPMYNNAQYKYRIVAGHCRHVACQVCEFKVIDCVIREGLSDEDAMILNFAENTQRHNLTILQEAKQIKRFIDAGMTRSEMVKKTGMLDGWIQVRTYLLQLPEYMQLEADAGILKQSDIRSLYTMHDNEEAQKQLYMAIKSDRVRGVTTDVNKHIQKNKKSKRSPAEITNMCIFLVDSLGPSVLTRCLAWASGNISDSEWYAELFNHSKTIGKMIEIPPYLQQEVAVELAKMEKQDEDRIALEEQGVEEDET